MRHKSEYAPRDWRVAGALKTKDQPRNNATIGAKHCHCFSLKLRNIPGVCATCARFDAQYREVALRRLIGYQGFSA